MSDSQQAWEYLRTDPEETLSNLDKIAFCCEHLLRIVDQKRNVIPLRLNATQRLIVAAYVAMRKNHIPVRLICTKGRQQGSSTVFSALLQLEMWAYPNTSVLVATEEKGGSAINLFIKYRSFMQKCPLVPEGLRLKDLFTAFLDGKSFTLSNGSSLRVEGEKEIVSWTTTAVHISEAAFFTNFTEWLGHMLQGVATEPHTSVFIESTAKEYGDGFYDEWTRAESGESDFTSVFAAWYIHEANTMSLPTDLVAKNRFLNNIGTEISTYGDEKALQIQYNLTDEQLFWRRWQIKNSCQGSLSEFSRQYPCNAREAFLAADRPVFHTESLEYIHSQTTLPKWTGEMRHDLRAIRQDGTEEAEFHETHEGAIEIWERPKKFETYCAGSDHAEGIPGGDFNAGLIAARNPFRVVAKIRGSDTTKLEALQFARQWYYLLRWYNNADVLGESNHQGGGMVLGLLEDWEYPNLMFEFEIFPQKNGKPNTRVGWLSTQGRRKDGIDLLRDSLLYDFSGKTPRRISEWTPDIPDRELIEECMHMTYSSRGKPEAKKKGQPRKPGVSGVGYHDDLVFACMSLIFAHKNLAPPKSKEQIMVEELGPRHPFVEDLPPEIIDKYSRQTIDDSPGSWRNYL